MRGTNGLLLVALLVIAGCATPAAELGALCELEGPESLKPKTFGSIRIGMTRAQVERVLGREKYSPIDGQDYFSTAGDCEVEPGVMASCGYVIEYRDYSKEPVRDTGRVMSCSWGGIGE
jgi:hypothetical protein